MKIICRRFGLFVAFWSHPVVGLATSEVNPIPVEESLWIDTTTVGDGETRSSCRDWPSNCTMTDVLTGISWTRVLGRSQSWNEADASCGALHYNGLAGWRLPTIDELSSAFEHGASEHASKEWISELDMAAPYWSASVPDFNRSFAWYGGFGLNFSFYDLKSYKNWFVCVK
jgi:hypothetical protein